MKYAISIAAALASISIVGCDKPTVVNVPPPQPTTVVVPGPAGPPGEVGAAGREGQKGEPGKNADGTTIVVVPAPPPPRSN
ncbi:MAG: hypothetical protein H7232_15425 [Aeromicrobium sp.]|nr:hypothetical protein [Burkholderiales bacterium]